MNGIGRLDIKQLRILDALLREHNLSKVAKQMGLTQQAISEQLRKLRDIFDDRLLIREGNQMVATPQAEELGEKIALILAQFDTLLEPKKFEPSTYHGVFQISATDYAIEAVLPELLKELRQQAPKLKLIVRDFNTDNIEEQLTSGEVDLALAFPEFVPTTLPTLTLFTDRHICVASTLYDQQQQIFTLQQLAALPQLVISPSRANLKGSHDAWFAEQGLTRNIVMSVPSFKAAPDILHTTDMIAFYPARLLPNPKVTPLQTQVTTPSFDVIAAWHQRSEHSPIHQWIRQKLSKLSAL